MEEINVDLFNTNGSNDLVSETTDIKEAPAETEANIKNSSSIISPVDPSLNMHRNWNATLIKIRKDDLSVADKMLLKAPIEKPHATYAGKWKVGNPPPALMQSEQEILQYYSAFSETDRPNWAVRCGDEKARIIVIDIDVKGEGDGVASYRYLLNYLLNLPDGSGLQLRSKLLSALTIHTPSTGKHVYLKCAPGYDIGAKKANVGKYGGIDFQRTACYVLGEGSTIHGKQYVRWNGDKKRPMTKDEIDEIDSMILESKLDAGTSWLDKNAITEAEMRLLEQGLEKSASASDAEALKNKMMPAKDTKVGDRNRQLMFHALYWKGKHPEDVALKMLHAFNKELAEPVDEQEVEKVHRSVQRPSMGDKSTMPALIDVEVPEKKERLEIDLNVPELELIWSHLKDVTEADKLLFFVSLITLLSSLLGPKPFFYNNKAQIFTLILGDTGSNKGTSFNRAKDLIDAAFAKSINGNPLDLFNNASSGQALVTELQDVEYDPEYRGLLGKFDEENDLLEAQQELIEHSQKDRVLVWREMEEMWALGKIQASTLQQNFNHAYDHAPLESNTKKEKIKASRFSLAVIAMCTQEAVEEHVTPLQARNGSMNRYAHFLNQPNKKIMYGTRKLVFCDEVLAIIRELVLRAQCASKHFLEYEIASRAEETWRQAIDEMLDIDPKTIQGALQARGRDTVAKFVMNLAGVFDPEMHSDGHKNCVTKVREIQPYHITNAMHFMRKSREAIESTYETNHETLSMLDLLEAWDSESLLMTTEAIRKNFSHMTSHKRHKLLEKARELGLVVEKTFPRENPSGRKPVHYELQQDNFLKWRKENNL